MQNPATANGTGQKLVNQQPQLRADIESLTPEEREQLKGVQRWAQIRRERRIAAGMDPDDKPRKAEKGSETKEEKAKRKADVRAREVGREQEEREEVRSNKCWACLTCCCLCTNCCS